MNYGEDMGAPVFDKIYHDYLEQVAALDLRGKPELLGIHWDGNAVGIPFLNEYYTITREGIADQHGKRPPHSVSVILCKYLLLCPETTVDGRDLLTYKDFRDAAPYVLGFRNTAEKPIARVFSGRIDTLEERSRQLGGKTFDMGITCDLSYVFQPLPEVPIYMLYNDEDEEFPADCSLLFERRAGHYLDMECLAMIGMLLAERLARTEEKDTASLS
jgi:hypothetical protein